jgi:acyl-[acyl carrier protein]--UDP-N-acetylglucosamine O-acyltransferase
MGTGNIIYPHAVIGCVGFQRGVDFQASNVVIGNNNKIGVGVCIMNNVIIRDCNLIMNMVNVGHDSTIGSNNEIGAGTIICGHVNISDENKIKVHCSIRNRVTIGSRNLIGMGANVVKSIGDDNQIKGNPAK